MTIYTYRVYYNGKKRYKSFNDYKKARAFCDAVDGIITTFNRYNGKYTTLFYFEEV